MRDIISEINPVKLKDGWRLPRRVVWGLAVAGVCLVMATAFFAVPGYLTWDSGTYHMMVRSLNRTGAFLISNGYDELHSPLLAVGQTMVKNGRIVSQYPEYYTLLTLPFYMLLGYRGLMVLNACAFVGICILIYRMARWFGAERPAPAAAVMIYGLATYAIEFTQSSYPHLTSTFLIFASAYLLWGTLFSGEDQFPPYQTGVGVVVWRSVAAGILFGTSLGVRLDSAFAGLAFIMPFLILRKFNRHSFIAFGMGILPPLLGLCWINLGKFGSFSPLHYGKSGSGFTGSLAHYLPIAVVLIQWVGLGAWHRVRPFRLSRNTIVIILIAGVVLLVALPQGRRLLRGVFQIAVDMRLRPDVAEPALYRSSGGAVVYWYWVKKSLIESCPYLILIVIPAIVGICKGVYGRKWLLWLIPFGFVGFFGYLAWHGSVGWNMRYLNPALPFLAILAALEIERLWAFIPASRAYFWIRNGLLLLLFVGILRFGQSILELQEAIFLNVGLMFAAVLLLLQGIEFRVHRKHSVRAGNILALVFIISLVWSSALTMMDYVNSYRVRNYFLGAARSFDPEIEADALIFTSQPDFTWPLLDSGKEPIIANYNLGTENDALELIERASGRRPVYWISGMSDEGMARKVFSELRKQNVIVEVLFESIGEKDTYSLYEIRLGKQVER